VLEQRAYMLGQLLTDIDDQIDSMERRLELRELTLREKFTRLETTLARLQAQGNQLLAAVSYTANQ